MHSPSSNPRPALRLLEKCARRPALPPAAPPPQAWWARWLGWMAPQRR